jgi:hypothetical protein
MISFMASGLLPGRLCLHAICSCAQAVDDVHSADCHLIAFHSLAVVHDLNDDDVLFWMQEMLAPMFCEFGWHAALIAI